MLPKLFQTKIFLISVHFLSLISILSYYLISIFDNFTSFKSYSNPIISFIYGFSLNFYTIFLLTLLILILISSIFYKKSKIVSTLAIISIIIYFLPIFFGGMLYFIFQTKIWVLLYLLTCLGSYSLTIIFSCLS